MNDADTDPGPDPPAEPDGDDQVVDDTVDVDAVEELAEAASLEQNSRNWLKGLRELLHSIEDAQPSEPRVRLAYDLLRIAACERAARICRSDLADDRG